MNVKRNPPWCLRVWWKVPVHMRFAILYGVAAGVMSGIFIDSWLPSMAVLPPDLAIRVFRIIVVALPALLIGLSLAVVAGLILRPRRGGVR